MEEQTSDMEQPEEGDYSGRLSDRELTALTTELIENSHRFVDLLETVGENVDSEQHARTHIMNFSDKATSIILQLREVQRRMCQHENKLAAAVNAYNNEHSDIKEIKKLVEEKLKYLTTDNIASKVEKKLIAEVPTNTNNPATLRSLIKQDITNVINKAIGNPGWAQWLINAFFLRKEFIDLKDSVAALSGLPQSLTNVQTSIAHLQTQTTNAENNTAHVLDRLTDLAVAMGGFEGHVKGLKTWHGEVNRRYNEWMNKYNGPMVFGTVNQTLEAIHGLQERFFDPEESTAKYGLSRPAAVGSFFRLVNNTKKAAEKAQEATTKEKLEEVIGGVKAIEEISTTVQNLPSAAQITQSIELLQQMKALEDSNPRATEEAVKAINDSLTGDAPGSLRTMLSDVSAKVTGAEVTSALESITQTKAALDNLNAAGPVLSAIQGLQTAIESAGNAVSALQKRVAPENSSGSLVQDITDHMQKNFSLAKRLEQELHERCGETLTSNIAIADVGLIKHLPKGFNWERVVDFCGKESASLTTIWGTQLATSKFQITLAKGHSRQVFEVHGDSYDNSIAALSSSLFDKTRLYEPRPIGMMLSDLLADDVNWDQWIERAIEVALTDGWLDSSEDSLDVLSIELKKPQELNVAKIRIILAGLTAYLEEQRDHASTERPSRIALGICVRSSQFGGYRLILTPEATDDTWIVWLFSEDGYADSQDADFDHWHFGTNWSGICPPNTSPFGQNDDRLREITLLKHKLSSYRGPSRMSTPHGIRPSTDFEGEVVKHLFGDTAAQRSRSRLSIHDVSKAPGGIEKEVTAPTVGGPQISSQTQDTEDQEHDEHLDEVEHPPLRPTGGPMRKLKKMGSTVSEKFSKTFGKSKQSRNEPPEEPESSQPVSAPRKKQKQVVGVVPTGALITPTQDFLETFGGGEYRLIGPVGNALSPSMFENAVIRVLNRAELRKELFEFNTTSQNWSCVESYFAKVTTERSRSTRGWTDRDGPCDECKLLGNRQCVLVIGPELVVVKGFVPPHETPQERTSSPDLPSQDRMSQDSPSRETAAVQPQQQSRQQNQPPPPQQPAQRQGPHRSASREKFVYQSSATSLPGDDMTLTPPPRPVRTGSSRPTGRPLSVGVPGPSRNRPQSFAPQSEAGSTQPHQPFGGSALGQPESAPEDSPEAADTTASQAGQGGSLGIGQAGSSTQAGHTSGGGRPEPVNPEDVDAPTVPHHYGGGVPIYVGPQSDIKSKAFDALQNADCFDEDVKVALSKFGTSSSGGKKARIDPTMFRRQNANTNTYNDEHQLKLCIISSVKKVTAPNQKWSDPTGPCDICHKEGRQCVVMIDEEWAFWKGHGQGV